MEHELENWITSKLLTRTIVHVSCAIETW